MLEFLADQNFNDEIIAGLRGRVPSVDIIRARELGLAEAEDPAILERAALEGRTVLTHDRRMTGFVYLRVAVGHPMPGVFVLPQQPANPSVLLANLQSYTEYSLPGEWEGQVLWINDRPL